MQSRSIPLRDSLSTKLLLCTVMFVFVAEIVVLIPSVSTERINWLKSRVEAAYLVSLALEGPRDQALDERTARQLFSTADILGVTVNHTDFQKLILAPEIDPHGPPRMHRIDLMNQSPLTTITNAWGTMFSNGDDLIQVEGAPRFASDRRVNIIVSQRALRSDLNNYALNILGLSLIISSVTATLVYGALNRIIVHPVSKLSKNMMAFEDDPDRADLIYTPSERKDEIGVAEKSLAAMQKAIHDMLNERRRLAALGAGISKISHDLRNILASAQLMSDRLSKSDDPQVRKLNPRLLSALDRAITLSRDTLAFGGMEARRLQKSNVDLHALVEEVLEDTASMHVEPKNHIDEGETIVADRTQLYRSFFNLAKNSIEAMTADISTEDTSGAELVGEIRISAERTDEKLTIAFFDDGPGIPDHARDALFEPFKGSKKPGGSGLGVAISAEIIRAHGGAIELEKTGPDGTLFQITLPIEP